MYTYLYVVYYLLYNINGEVIKRILIFAKQNTGKINQKLMKVVIYTGNGE